eukprot:262717_1
MGDSDEFQQITKVVGFLALVWIWGRLCKFIKLSPLIGWITAGLIFGPGGPESTQLIEHPEVWKLLGTLGVTLMIAESGTHIHFDKVRKVGLTSVFVALIGTFLPLLLGFLFVLVFKPSAGFRPAFATGCAMAPTSVSVALKLLTEANQLNSLPGQTIVTAAFLDDVFSIILLVILKSFSKDNQEQSLWPTVFAISSKFLFCFLFLSIGVILAMYCFSHFIPKLLHWIPSYDNINYQPRDELHLIVMILILVSYSFIGDKIGSHLLGAFIAGMSFSQVGRSMYVWRRQMKRLCGWLIKLFFACSVAFTIPTTKLIQLEAFGKGLILALIAGVLGKVLSGFVCRPQYRYIIGFAMVGRGEFAYLVAAEANKTLELIDDDLYAIVVWALLIAVIIAPIAFGSVLQNAFKQNTQSGIKWFKIKAEAKHHTGVHFEVVDVLHNLKLDILEAKVETDGDTDCSEFIVGVGGDDCLDNDKVHEILHDIREAVGDTMGQVQLLPIDEEDILPLLTCINTTESENVIADTKDHLERVEDASKVTTNVSDSNSVDGSGSNESDDYLLEIKLMSQHSPQIFAELIEEMELNSIQLHSGHLEDFLNTDSLCIFGKIHKNNCRAFNIKKKLKNVLKVNNIPGEILVKKVRRDVAVLPHYVTMSDLLQSSNKNNPLLSNKVQNGYEIEIDICCYDYVPHLILSLCSIFHSLDLDIRTIHVDTNEDKQNEFNCNAIFFVQEKENNTIDQNRRYDIECRVAQIFQRRNVFASIKTKAIEIGKKSMTSDHREKTVIPCEMDEIVIDTDLQEEVEMNNLAAITESQIIVTPKRHSALPPSVEKREVTRNYIGLLHDIPKDADSEQNSNCSVIDILSEQ